MPEMDALDRRLLELVNQELPLVAEPFAELGQRLGMSATETIERLRRLKAAGHIRRIGATIAPAGLGWYSTLCACEIPAESLDAYAATVNALAEVTHNYLREGSPNCWFTLITPDRATALTKIAELESQLGVEISEYPARRVFKIRAQFRLAD